MGTLEGPRELEYITAQIDRCRASLPTHPAPFRVLGEHLDAGWYDELLSDLAVEYQLGETTDLNYDRGRFVRLTAGEGAVVLALSLWGRFAYVLTTTKPIEFLDWFELAPSLARTLRLHNLELLSPETLRSLTKDFDGQQREVWKVMFYETD